MDEIEKLMIEFANASFDCGEWNGRVEEEPDYDELLQRFKSAQEALRTAIAQLGSQSSDEKRV